MYHHGICNPTLPLADYRFSVDRNIGQPYPPICNGAISQDEKMLRYTVNDNTYCFSDADNVNVWNTYTMLMITSIPGMGVTLRV